MQTSGIFAAKGLETMTEADKEKVRNRYKKAGIVNLKIVMDEINAHYVENTLTNKNILERLLQKNPTVKERMLSFFKKAEADYAADENLSGAAKKLYKQYKKLFEEFSKKNYGNNAFGLTAGSFTNSEITGDTDKKTTVSSVNTENTHDTERYALKPYSEKQVENWKSSKKIVIYESPAQLRTFVKMSRANGQYNKKIYFGAIGTALAERIYNDTGLNLENYNVTLYSNEIRKIFKDHGNEELERLSGQRAVTETDFLQIPDVMQNATEIYRSKVDYDGKPAITFVKADENSWTTVLAVVSDKHLDLRVQTEYIHPQSKKGTLATPLGEQAPNNTPKASGGTDSTNSISQNQQNVNTETENNSDERLALPINIKEQINNFERQVDNIDKIPAREALVVCGTPQVFLDIGLNNLPMTLNLEHAQDAIKLNPKHADRFIGKTALKSLPEKLQNPIAIIASKTGQSTSLVAIVDLQGQNGKSIITPVYLNGESKSNGIRMNVNAIKSAHERKNAISYLLMGAINNETNGKISIFYVDNKKATQLIRGEGLQLPNSFMSMNGFIHSISENGSPVKGNFKKISQTETKQFKTWFGNSKVIDANGKPKIVYHGTNSNFNVFDPAKFNQNEQHGDYVGEAFFFADTIEKAQKYGNNVIPVYLSIKNPLIIDTESTAQKFREQFKGMFKEGNPKIRELIGGKYDYYEILKSNPRQIREYLQNKGYDGLIDNIYGQYAVFENTQIKSATDNIGTFDVKNPDIRYALDDSGDSGAKITIGSTDHERYLALKDRKLSLSARTNTEKLDAVMKKIDITQETFDYSAYGDRSRLFKKIGDEFDLYKQYSNRDVKLEFSFSKSNMAESISKQRRNYYKFAKLLSCFDTVIENAIGIEIHNRNADGYKFDDTLKQCYVLASAFVDGNNIVPVKLEVKEFSDKENTLHIAIALESIKKDEGISARGRQGGVAQQYRPSSSDEIVTQEVAENGVAQQYAPSSTISIADFFAKINPSDESFYKYIPKEFLQDSDNKAPTADKDIRYALDIHNDYTYESLVKKPDMTITEVTEALPRDAEGKISRSRVRAMALANVRKQNNPKNTADLVYAHCDDTGTDIRVGSRGLNHGLDRRVEVNAKASLVIGDLIKNAIKVNEVNSLSQGHEGDYVLLSCFSDETGVYGVSIYVDRVSNEVTGMDSIDILYSVNGKKIGTAAPNAEVSDRSPSPTVPTISISQLLEKSNTKFKDIFSKDVYEHFGTEKDTSTKLGSSTRYALPKTDSGDSGTKITTDFSKAPTNNIADYIAAVEEILLIDSTNRYRGKLYNDILSKGDSDKVVVSKGKQAQLRANYQGEKVFYKKDVEKALKKIDVFGKLSADIRNELSNSVWKGYNDRLDDSGYEKYMHSTGNIL